LKPPATYIAVLFPCYPRWHPLSLVGNIFVSFLSTQVFLLLATCQVLLLVATWVRSLNSH
jgi:hypothetical protein